MAKPKKDEQHPAIQLMRALYQQTKGGYVELRAISADGTTKRTFATSRQEIVAFIDTYGAKDGDFSVYFGVNKRDKPKGTKDAIKRVSALYVDIDTVKNGWDTDEFVKLVYAMPGSLRPSACVRSGGGLHLYWFVDTWMIAGGGMWHPEDANKLLRDIFAGDAVQNIDRILRAPGSYNHKRKKKCELEWCNSWERFDLVKVMEAAQKFPNVIGDDGVWVKREKQAKIDARRAEVTGEDAYERMFGQNTRSIEKNIEDMWAKRVRYHAPRGYVGIHEAALLHTARLFIANPDYPEETVIRLVMDKIKAVKARDAADEVWDMKKEAETVRKMYRSWQPKWKEIAREHRRQRAEERKKNGRAAPLRQRDR